MRLWPFALEYGVYILSHIPNDDYDVKQGMTQVDLCTGTKMEFSVLRNEHTWGWPRYVLDLKL